MKRLFLVLILLFVTRPAVAQFGFTRSNGAKTGAATGNARLHPAVVRIIAPGRGSVSYGSGTLIDVNDQHGLVITNWHVINEATGQISVVFPDGFESGATVQKVDRDWDLAALAIWRPRALPVRLANEAPRPGEVLSIAGYGSGKYRMVSGACTQYVAPGQNFPFEMVELAASARQGDSGGPIFNSRGELAGVLFGAGHGHTSGSYCGRVRWFLTSVVPDKSLGPGRETMIAQAQPRVPAQPATARTPQFEDPSQDLWRAPERPAATYAPSNAQGRQAVVASVPRRGGPPIAAVAPSAQRPTQHIGWSDLAGNSLLDQFKTVFAGIGALALVLHTIGWISRERK